MEGEGDKIKHSSKSPATAFSVGIASIREGSLSTELVAVQPPKTLEEPQSVANEEPSEQGWGM